MLATPKIISRKLNQAIYQNAIADNLDPVIAKIIAGRNFITEISPAAALNPKLKFLDNPAKLADIDKASQRLAQAIINKEVIGLETDHDCDGQTSHAVLYECLTKHFNHPGEKIRSYIGHRLQEGYGLSLKLAQRILRDDIKPSLIVTADNGSTDDERIKLLKANNIDTIVTDHHAMPQSGPPKHALAVLNPTRDDCDYPDRLIAGCMVAWLLMTKVRQELIKQNHLAENAPSLADVLDFVAVGTVADCVSMSKSINNRAVVNYGLKLIRQYKRPCWRAIDKILGRAITSEDLGFTIGPLLNSDGRLSTAMSSVTFLLAKDDFEALTWVNELQLQNNERKKIQKDLLAKGDVIAARQAKDNFALSIFLADGHSGVHGIAASRLKDSYGMPCVFLAPKSGEQDLITGSVRGIEGFNVHRALSNINQKFPEILLAFGGHTGAGGLTLNKNNLNKFTKAFQGEARAQLTHNDIGPAFFTDGEVSNDYLSLDFVDELNLLEPYGREFEPALFKVKGEVVDLRLVGADKIHAQITLNIAGKKINCICFNLRKTESSPIPVSRYEQVEALITLKDNIYMGKRSFNPQILYIK